MARYSKKTTSRVSADTGAIFAHARVDRVWRKTSGIRPARAVMDKA